MLAFIAFLQALPAFLASLPTLFQLLLKLMSLTERMLAWAKQNNLNEWIDRLEQTMNQVEDAKTPEEQRRAARGLVDIIRTIRK